jgi:hypothetical protein
MLEKVSEMAERTATNVSRRQFLGRFGRTATSAAAVLGGFLAFPGLAAGGRKPRVLCNAQSVTACINHYVGDKCGKHSRCEVHKESTDNYCYCRQRGGGGGGRRRGGGH